MKKKNKNLLVTILIIVGTLAIITSTLLLLLQNRESNVNCFPEGNYLCENSTEINGFFYCDIDDIVKCDNGCKVTKFGDDYCIK